MTAATIINAGLAAACAGVVFGCINRMHPATNHAVRGSVLLLFTGLLAQALAAPMSHWEGWADTLLYGAIAALVVATRRLPTGIPAERTATITYSIIGGTLALATTLAYL